MKNARIQTALGLLLLTAGLIIWSFCTVNSELEALLHRTEEAMQTQSAETVSALGADWEKAQFRLHFFIPSEQLADLNEAILRLPDEQQEDAQAELAGIRADLIWLKRQERFVF